LAVFIAKLPTQALNIYVDQLSLTHHQTPTFASVLKTQEIWYFQSVLNVILLVLIDVECILSVSYVSASNKTAVRVVQIDCVDDCFILQDISAQDQGVCQVAVVELVAVSTCPFVGAVALDTSISVVALFNNLAVIVLVLPVIVLFVNVFAADIVSTTTHSIAITHADDRVIEVSEALPTSS
jgi:hypothetical protein